MMEHFENWLKKTENKTDQTAYNYSRAINRISRHYSENTKQNINLYSVVDLPELKSIQDLYGITGKYSEFGNTGNGTNRASINSLYRFRENTVDTNFSKLNDFEDNLNIDYIKTNIAINSNNFNYEKDLKSSIVYQLNELFPEYKIFGFEDEGIEYSIGGKRIDILLENTNGNLLAVELKSGLAKFEVFGQISMYLGLLMEKFPERDIKGCIIAGEIDNSLKNANKVTNLVTLMAYDMKLELTKE